jgi:putative transposase
MPWGLERYERCGELHFVTFSCYDRLPYLETIVARDLFLDSLETARQTHRLAVHGYVAMPEHVHLLVGAQGGAGAAAPNLDASDLEAAVDALKAEVAERLGRRPCWLGGFDDLKVHTDRQRTERLMYMHRNPVQRGLVRQPKDWRWSSFLACSTGERGLVEVVAV